MTLFLQILRVVCGLVTAGVGAYVAACCVRDALRWRRHHLNRERGARKLTREDVRFLLICVALIGSGVLNFMAVWS